MRRLLTIILTLLLVVMTSGAQELTVKSMEMAPFDLTASVNQVLDLNQNPCALVKVQLAAQGAEFRGNVIPPVKHEASTYLVYMTEGSKMLNVQCPGYLPMMVYFRDYGIQRLESKVTYVLTLVMPQAPQKEDLQYLIVNVTPKNATLFVDDNLQVVQDGMVALRFPKGSSHTYRADAVGYETERGTVEIGEGRKTVNVVLKRSSSQSAAATGSLDVNYQPFDSEVWLDGKRIGVSPDIFKGIAVGTHNVEIRAAGMNTAKHTVNIVSGETAQLSGQLTSPQPSHASPQPSPNGEGAQTDSWTNSSASSSNSSMPVPEAVDLGLSVKWASFNLGASKPEGYGYYYKWGETKPDDTHGWSTYKYAKGSTNTLTKYCSHAFEGYNGFNDGKTKLEPMDDAATVNLGGKWRMPTYDEINELINKCKREWTSVNGINGIRVIGPNGESIFFPATGYRENSDGSLSDVGSGGEYWSATTYIYGNGYANYLYFGSFTCGWNWKQRAYSLPVRPVLAK